MFRDMCCRQFRVLMRVITSTAPHNYGNDLTEWSYNFLAVTCAPGDTPMSRVLADGPKDLCFAIRFRTSVDAASRSGLRDGKTKDRHQERRLLRRRCQGHIKMRSNTTSSGKKQERPSQPHVGCIHGERLPGVGMTCSKTQLQRPNGHRQGGD